MKKLIFVLSFLLILLTASAQKDYWQQQVNYIIDVTLNDSNHTLDGYVKMEYTNHSPDTLHYIWIHLWPNAYKNDRTAFSDQMLENGRTDFYFSNADKRGYINRLDFKVDGDVVKMEDHPQHQDIIKLVLTKPIRPNSTVKIETPFHEQLPENFSRGGHHGQSYQVTQWYPKPAVYDRKGWHPMPYLDQGEFYSEFGNYKVSITVPSNYVVAATGVQTKENIEPASAKPVITVPVSNQKIKNPYQKKEPVSKEIPSATNNKTVTFEQDNIHDFAWFADKGLVVLKDTLALPSGKIIDVMAYHLEDNKGYWKKSLSFIKNSILTRSKWLGEYPYATVKVIEAKMGFTGGMEYPTITSISPAESEESLEGTIEHEVGHNWNFGILASNEREHPWMDEGINSFYGRRYSNEGYHISKQGQTKTNFITGILPENTRQFNLDVLISRQADQPFETNSESFSEQNYYTIAYNKTAVWLQLLEAELGRSLFDSCMHAYYNNWKFKHPYPEDFKQVFEQVSGRNLDAAFAQLSKKGMLPGNKHRSAKLVPFISFRETDKYRYIGIAPAAGYNFYDKFMIGALIHNYSLPSEKFQFLAAPLYATGSKQFNGMGRLSYSWYPKQDGTRITIALAGGSFNSGAFTDSTDKKNFFRFSKLAPAITYQFGNRNPRSSISKFIQWKTFLFRETGLLFTRDTINQLDVITYPVSSRYLNQLRFVIRNNRALYPYDAEFKAEQGDGFARLAFTGNYYFNYAKGGGLNLRLFAGKFIYLGDKTFIKQFETDPYHLNMSGPKGYEDYTYSNYFIGRSEFDKLSSQQIMNRDGFFKVRTDLLSSKVGKTDNWLASLNLVTDIPKKINPLEALPVKIPLRLFVDIGTYAEAWNKNAPTGRFVYDAGLQVSLFKNVLNIYAPILYSKVYGDYFKSTIPDKRFLKNISFSIDIDRLSVHKFIPQIAF